MSELTIYMDYISQPCRAVAILLKINKIPFKEVIVDILKGESKTNPELKELNPNQKIPTLLDGDFSLYESNAILKYLCATQPIDERWYPKDPKKRALVDQYLDWHHLSVRISTEWFLSQYVTKQPPTHPKILDIKSRLMKSMEILDTSILKKSKYLAGDTITIADIQLLCELAEFWVVGKNLYEGYPNVEKWVEICIKELQPHFDTAHEVVYKAKEGKVLGLDPEPLKPTT